MTQSPLALNVGGIEVRQHAGLFLLNDLHRAAGGEKRHQPNHFLSIDQTQALIAELKAENLPAVETVLGKGKAQGTYACRELVIAYAAWINAAFHLKVIRVFLAATAPQTALPGDTLTLTQGDELRAMLETAARKLPADKRGKFLQSGWAKLRAHTGVNYRQIPQAAHTDALSLLARHVAEWELVDEPAALPAPAPTLRGRRWLIATDTQGRESVQPIADDDFITTWPALVAGVESGECLRTSAELLAMASACTRRVQQRTLRN